MGVNVVFMGSPNFAIPVLKALNEHYRVIGVITQPDKPAGRGKQLTSPPIKTLADTLGLPTIQPRRLRDPEAMAWLTTMHPDLIVVAAFGQILRKEVLDMPPYGCINVHASLLPRWRGAAPIQATILNGDSKTGVTIMRMDAGVDTGPILAQRETPIQLDETAGELGDRLSGIGADLLVETIPGYLDGSIKPALQNELLATRASLLKKENGSLDFNLPAEFLDRQVRAYQPWPGSFTMWQEQVFKVLRSHVFPYDNPVPGKRIVINGVPGFGTVKDVLLLDEVQPAGKKPMPGQVFVRGARDWAED